MIHHLKGNVHKTELKLGRVKPDPHGGTTCRN